LKHYLFHRGSAIFVDLFHSYNPAVWDAFVELFINVALVVFFSLRRSWRRAKSKSRQWSKVTRDNAKKWNSKCTKSRTTRLPSRTILQTVGFEIVVRLTKNIFTRKKNYSEKKTKQFLFYYYNTAVHFTYYNQSVINRRYINYTFYTQQYYKMLNNTFIV